jgi:SET domain-containing protein 6
MGNLILSRSFTLDDQDEDEEEEQEEKDHATGDEHQDIGNTSLGSAMDVDAPVSATNEHLEEEESDDGDDDEETNALEIAMVPLADILNARYQCENVRNSSVHPLRQTANYTIS